MNPKTVKKLVTVAWSASVVVDLPEYVGIDELDDFNAPKKIQDLASNAVKEAWDNVSWKDGIITDVQEI